MVRFFLFFLIITTAAQAQDTAFKSTEFPVPRFVSTRSDQVYVRTGPGQKYPILWVYNTSGIPVEIVLEYDNWRKIKDFDGQTGWVHKSLLTGRRYAFVGANENQKLFRKPNKNNSIIALLEPKSRVKLEACGHGWCEINAQGYKGWIEQKALWGVYDHEEFD